MDFEEVFEKYHDAFDEWFPTMCFQADSDEDLIKRMEQCLKSGKPAKEEFNLDYGLDMNY